MSVLAPTLPRPACSRPRAGHLVGGVRDHALVLLAVGLPLAFNPAGTLAFEPFKLGLVRLTAVALALSWAGSIWAGGRLARSGDAPFGGGGLDRAGLAYLGATAAATLASIHPLQSLLGSYDRLQGLLTLVALLLIYTAAARVRPPEKLVDALLLGSGPVCLYALVQQAGLDPLAWLDRTPGPPSSVGSSTALGGYLAMLVPLTLARAAAAAGALAPAAPLGTVAPKRSTCRYVGLLVLAGLQVVGVLASTVRGAQLGLVVGLGLLSLLLRPAAARGRALLALGLLGAGLLGIGLLNLADRPSGLPRDGRSWLEQVVAAGGDDLSVQERLLIWQTALETWLASGPRVLVGFGPETQALTLEARFPVALANRWPNLRFDRAHTFLLDELLTTGLLGLVARLGLVVMAIAGARRVLRSSADRWLPAALLATVCVHLVESGVAFSSATTLVVWWLALGMLAGLGERPAAAKGQAAGTGRRAGGRGRRILAVGLAASSLALVPVVASPLLADLAYTRSRAFHAGEDLPGELSWLRRAVALAPDRDLYPLALGLALAAEVERAPSAGRRGALLDEAEASIRRAIAINPAEPYNHFHLGRVLALRSEAERAPAVGQESVLAYERAAALSPNRGGLLDAAGLALLRAGQAEAAVTRFRQAAALHERDAEREARIGDGLLLLGRLAEAAASYERALALDSRSAPAQAGLAGLYARRGDRDAALEAARLAVRYESRDWRHREALADLERQAGHRGQALAQARAAARFAPPWERERLRDLIATLRRDP